MPVDLSIMGVYLPPLFAAFLLSLFAATATMKLLSSQGLIAWFSNPSLVYFAVVAIYTVVLSSSVFSS